MLLVTRYINALFLTIVGLIAIGSTLATIFLPGDKFAKIGGLFGAASLLLILGLPYYFSYRATKTRAERDLKFALVMNTSLIAIVGIAMLVCLAATQEVTFIGFLFWLLPAFCSVNTFAKWPTKQTPAPSTEITATDAS